MRTCTKCGWPFRPEGKAVVCRSCWGGTEKAAAEPMPPQHLDISEDAVLQQTVKHLVRMAGDSAEDA